jgi:hypothetical protein
LHRLTHFLLISIVTSFLFGCKTEAPVSEKNNVEETAQSDTTDREESTVIAEVFDDTCSYSFQLAQWSSEFYYVNPINVYTIDSVSNFDRKTYGEIDSLEDCITPILGELRKQIMQDSTLNYSGDTTLQEFTGFLYTVQRITDNSFGIVIREMDDSWIQQLNYFSFNSQGCFIDQFVLASNGGDGGYHTNGGGFFENDSTYIYTEVETLHLTTDEEIEIRRTNSKMIIQTDGSIKTIVLDNYERELTEEELNF